jgi:hypothetical protein
MNLRKKYMKIWYQKKKIKLHDVTMKCMEATTLEDIDNVPNIPIQSDQGSQQKKHEKEKVEKNY